MSRFTMDNTEGYSKSQIAQLNARYDEGLLLLEHIEHDDKSYTDRLAELVQTQFDNEPPESPSEITIRTLKAEVERLAVDLEIAGSRLEGEGQGGRSAGLSALAARTLLARLAVFAFLALLSLPVFAAPKTHRHVTKPLSTITVKVVPHEAYIRGQKGPLAHAAWRITTVDIDSCTVWVDTTAPDVSGAEVGALRACRKAIDIGVSRLMTLESSPR